MHIICLCILAFLQEEKAKVIQTSLFVAGLNTLLQTCFGTRLPAVMGDSYTFVAPTISIILSGRWNDPDPISVCTILFFVLYLLNLAGQIDPCAVVLAFFLL